MKIFILICSLTLVYKSFDVDKTLRLNSKQQINKTLNQFQDTIEIVKIFGSNYKFDSDGRINCGMGRSTKVNWETRNYLEYGLTFQNYFSYSVMINDKNESELVSQNIGVIITLDSTSKINVYNLRPNHSTFNDLNKLKLKGFWLEYHSNNNMYYYSFVTKKTSFNTQLFSEAKVKSMNLDIENGKQVNNYFNEKKINNITISDNESLFKRYNK